MIRHLQPPAGQIDVRPGADWLEKCREHKTQLEEINPCPPDDILQPKDHEDRRKISHHADRREAPCELNPEKPRPILHLHEERFFPGFGRLVGVCRLRARASHEFAQTRQSKLRECSAVLGTVEGIIEALRGAGVGPVHRRIRRRGDGHIGVGQQSERHDERKVRNKPPLDHAPSHHNQHHQTEHHTVKKPDGRFQNQRVRRKNGKTQIAKQRCQTSCHHKI